MLGIDHRQVRIAVALAGKIQFSTSHHRAYRIDQRNITTHVPDDLHGRCVHNLNNTIGQADIHLSVKKADMLKVRALRW